MVGKSSLALQYVDGVFAEIYNPTVGIDFKIQTIEVENRKVKLQIVSL